MTHLPTDLQIPVRFGRGHEPRYISPECPDEVKKSLVAEYDSHSRAWWKAYDQAGDEFPRSRYCFLAAQAADECSSQMQMWLGYSGEYREYEQDPTSMGMTTDEYAYKDEVLEDLHRWFNEARRKYIHEAMRAFREARVTRPNKED